VRDLEETHGKRRDTVWASLNRAPLAHALRPLCALADATDAAVGGDAPEVVSEAYRQEGWRADAAALDALGSAREPRNAEAVRGLALNLLQQEKNSSVGVKNSRLRAGWNEDYLLKVLQQI
jgi:hypothetical protein